MMTNDKTERIRSIIGWMRKNIGSTANCRHIASERRGDPA